MEKIPNLHPGEVLHAKFLAPVHHTAYRLAKAIGIPQARVPKILKGKRIITADTALRLSYYFGNFPKFLAGVAGRL